MVNIGQCLGLLVVYTLGALMHWRTLSWAFLGINAISAVLCIFLIPETPYYLVNKYREDEALAVLKQLRGKHEDVAEEFAEILQRKKLLDQRSSSEQAAGLWSVLTSPSFVKPFLVIGTVYGLSQLGGIGNLSMYMVTVFQESGSDLDPYVCSIIVALARTVIACVSSFALHFLGRRVLFFGSALTISASLALMGTVAYLKEFVVVTAEEYEDEGHLVIPDVLYRVLNFIPVISVVVVYSAHSFGYGVVIRVVIAESFPTEIRSISSSLCLLLANLLLAGTGYLFPTYLELFGFHGTFWLYGGITFCVGIYGVIRIPESKGKSLVKMEELYEKKKNGNP